MFGRLTGSRPRTGTTAPPAAADWSRHRRFDDAAAAYFLHPEVAVAAVRGVLGRRRIRGFTLERVVDISESGASLWQEAAVLDDRRLILWHSEDLSEEEAGALGSGGGLLDSSLQVVPLDAIQHLGMRTLVGWDAAGQRTERGAYLVASTAALQEMATVQAGEDALPGARFRQEAFRFSKTVEEDGAGQVARLIAFGRILGRLAPHAGRRTG